MTHQDSEVKKIKTTRTCFLTPVSMVIIKQIRDNKCWGGYEEKGMLVHYWWECKLKPQQWKPVWNFLKK